MLLARTILLQVIFSSGGVRSNDPIRYSTNVTTRSSIKADAPVCALPGCDVAVVQPTKGGRRRLYCSNAHRAEARRRRIADSPEPAPGELIGPALERLAAVLDDLRTHETTLRSVDPGRQAVEIARVRAEATAEVLAAQEAGASAAEEAARISERLATERAEWEQQRSAHQGELEEMRALATTAREQAASAQDALDVALTAHRADLDERDRLAARSAATHADEVNRLSEQLDEARTAAAAADARAEAADHRAARADDASRLAAEHAATAEASLGQLQTDLARAHAVIESATIRAETAERLLEDARAELRAERDRNDVRLSQLHEQLAQLLARKRARRPAAKRASPKKKATADSR